MTNPFDADKAFELVLQLIGRHRMNALMQDPNKDTAGAIATLESLLQEVKLLRQQFAIKQENFKQEAGMSDRIDDILKHPDYRFKDLDTGTLKDIYLILKECNDLRTRLEECEQERVTLKHLNLCTFCAYCGEFFEADGDGRKTEAITEHIQVCEKHPMRELEARSVAFLEQAKALKSEIADYERTVQALRTRLEESESMEMKISGENMRLIAENAALRKTIEGMKEEMIIIADFAVGNGDVCELIARRIRKILGEK